MVSRSIKPELERALKRGKSLLVLGPRQVGKTTLLNFWPVALNLNLASVNQRQAFEKDPSRLTQEISALKGKHPLVLIDEIQKVPALLDEIQVLIDSKKAQFILTGSSARKLYRGVGANLLPGRIVVLRMDPFSFEEYPDCPLEQMLVDGQLPAITLNPSPSDRSMDLQSYVTTYLEEEVRQEALVRNIGAFHRFLEMAALESGRIVNFASISQELGPSIPTVSSYFDILYDCLIAERIDPITKSRSRKKLTKSPRALFYDLGVRRLAAGEGRRLGRERFGQLLEHWVGNECLKWIHVHHPEGKLRFWRDPGGPEVDWVVELEKALLPIEVKWSENINSSHIRGLETFLDEHPESRYAICVSRIPRKRKLSAKIFLIPWQDLVAELDAFARNS